MDEKHPATGLVGLIGGNLILAVRDEGGKRGWGLIRWITRDNNHRARSVYDRVAEKTDWNVYELQCPN